MKTTIINDYSDQTRYLLYNPILDGLAFCVNGSGHFYAGSRYLVERDSLMGMYLILYTISGCGCISYRNRELLLHPGQCILLNGEEYHKYMTSATGGEVWQFKWVRFKSEHAARYDELITHMQAVPVYVGGTSFERNNDLILELMDHNEPCKDMRLSGYADRMLTTMYICSQKAQDSGNSFSAEMEDSRQYILNHFQEPLTVAGLAERALMTEAAYIRKFRRFFSSSPYAFLQKVRMSHAAFWLETSDLSVSEICSRVGYGDQNNFSRQFKVYFGQSPSQYKQHYSMHMTNPLDD